MKKRKSKSIKKRGNNKKSVILGLLVVVLFMGVGFAAFNQRLTISENSSFNSNWNVYISDAILGEKTNDATGKATVDSRDSVTLITEFKSPGDRVVYDITVKNDGDVDAQIEVLTLKANNEDSVIKYDYAGISVGDLLKSGESKTFTITVEYDDSYTGTLEENQKNNSVKLEIDFSQIKNRVPMFSTGLSSADKLKAKAVTSGDGLYADSSEKDRYIYRGLSVDNYIELDGELWRIISIEADDTFKLMKNNSIGNRVYDFKGACNLVYDDSVKKKEKDGAITYEIDNPIYMVAASSTRGCNEWAGPAELNTYLNDKYYNNLSESVKSLIQARDFNIGAVTEGNTDLKQQLSNESDVKWSGNVGLITVSDYINANSNINQCGNYNLNTVNASVCMATDWMQDVVATSTYGEIWTISADALDAAKAHRIKNNGSIYSNMVYSEYGTAGSGHQVGVVPVIYISSNVSLSGSGTLSNPYVIK